MTTEANTRGPQRSQVLGCIVWALGTDLTSFGEPYGQLREPADVGLAGGGVLGQHGLSVVELVLPDLDGEGEGPESLGDGAGLPQIYRIRDEFERHGQSLSARGWGSK